MTAKHRPFTRLAAKVCGFEENLDSDRCPMWNKGFDTSQIGKTLRHDQATVERALHEGLEIQRKRARLDKSPVPSAD